MKTIAVAILAVLISISSFISALIDHCEFIPCELVEISVANGYKTAYQLYRHDDDVYVIAHGGHGEIRGFDGGSYKVKDYVPDFVGAKGLPTTNLHVLTCKLRSGNPGYGDVKPVFDRCDISAAIPVPNGFIAYDMRLSKLSSSISCRMQKMLLALHPSRETLARFSVHLSY